MNMDSSLNLDKIWNQSTFDESGLKGLVSLFIYFPFRLRTSLFGIVKGSLFKWFSGWIKEVVKFHGKFPRAILLSFGSFTNFRTYQVSSDVVAFNQELIARLLISVSSVAFIPFSTFESVLKLSRASFRVGRRFSDVVEREGRINKATK